MNIYSYSNKNELFQALLVKSTSASVHYIMMLHPCRSYLTSENERRTSALQIEAGEEEGDDTKQLTTKLDMDNNEMLAKRGYRRASACITFS